MSRRPVGNKRARVLGLLLLASACWGPSGDHGSGTRWVVERELLIGSLGDPLTSFGSVVGLARDGNGGIWVADWQTSRIARFDSLGRFVAAFGARGQGPGELGRILGLVALGERALVVDAGNAKYVLYDAEGALQAEYRRKIVGSIYPWRGISLRGMRFLDSYPTLAPDGVLSFTPVVVDLDTGAYDTLGAVAFQPRHPVIGVPQIVSRYLPWLFWTLNQDGSVLYGISDAYRVFRRNLEGRETVVLDRPHRPAPISSEDRAAILLEAKESGVPFDVALVPTTAPAFHGIFELDSGVIAILRPRLPSDERTVFDVFLPDGTYADTVSTDLLWKVQGPAAAVSGDRLLGVMQDSLGVEYVALLRFVSRLN